VKTPTRVLVVEVLGGRARAALVVRQGTTARVEATAHEERGRDEGCKAALAALAALPKTKRVPLLLVTRDVTPACLELPEATSALEPARLRELVRWEIEPFVPGEGELSCASAGKLAAGIRRPALERWRTELARAGHELAHVYPAAASALGALPLAERGCLLDVREDAVTQVRFDASSVQSVRTRAPGAPLLDLAGAGPVFLSGEGAEAARAELGERALPVNDAPALLPLLGAARHALGLEGAGRVPAIAACEPAAPLLRRPWVRAFASGLALWGVLGAADLVMTRETSAAEERTRELGRRLAAAPKAPPVEPRAALAAEVERLAAEEKALERDRARIQDEVLANAGLPYALLDAFARAADEDVTLERVLQEKAGEWRVSGFALSDTAVQRFSVALGKALARQDLETALLTVRGDRGRLGLAGWSFELSVGRRRGRP
jgi:hypothetical protein